jgi:transcriptional antiterminator RfaH
MTGALMAQAQTPPANNGDLAWYAAQLRPNGDALAMTHLQRQGFTPFRPLIWESRRTGQTMASFLRPMFPGYVFVQFDVTQPTWSKIRSTRGITRLIGNDTNGPRKLPTDLILDMKARCASNLPAGPSNAFEPGDQVHVACGPFADFLATVENVDAQQRVWLLIDFMGRSSRISAKPSDLMPKTARGHMT